MSNISDINFSAYFSSARSQLQNTWNSTGLTIADVIAIVFIIVVFFWIVTIKVEFVDLDGRNETKQFNELADHIQTTASGVFEAKNEVKSNLKENSIYINQVPYPRKEYAWWNFLKVDFN